MTADSGNPIDPEQRRARILFAGVLVLSISTYFSASSVLPQIQWWDLGPGQAAWLTTAVQIGFVGGALLSSLFNLSDIVSPKHVILAGALGATIVNTLLLVADAAGVGILLRFPAGFSLAGVHPPTPPR